MRRALLTLIPLVLVAACGEQEPAPDVRVDPPAVEEQEPVTPDASHDQAVRDAAERTLEAGSVRTESSLHLTDDEDGSLELEFHEHIRFGEVVRVSLSTAGASLMTLAFDGDDVYLTNGTVEDELGEGHWLRLERDEAFAAIDETMLSYLDDVEVTRQMFGGQLVESLLGALAGTDTVDLLGRDIVGGVAATHYLARIDEEQLDRATLQVEVWVGDDGFVRRAETIITSATGRPVVVSVDLHDHGRITDPLVPEAGLTVTAAEHEQRQVAEEDAHADRVDALDGGGLDQATIERLALPRLLPTPGWDDGGPERAFIRHPETEELCWAQRYSAHDAEYSEYLEGEWSASCGQPVRLNVDVPGYCGAADVLALELRTTPHDWAALGQAMVDMNLAWTAGTAGSDRDPFVGYSELLDYDGQTMVALDSLGHYGYPDQDREGEETARLHVAAAAEICA